MVFLGPRRSAVGSMALLGALDLLLRRLRFPRNDRSGTGVCATTEQVTTRNLCLVDYYILKSVPTGKLYFYNIFYLVFFMLSIFFSFSLFLS